MPFVGCCDSYDIFDSVIGVAGDIDAVSRGHLEGNAYGNRKWNPIAAMVDFVRRAGHIDDYEMDKVTLTLLRLRRGVCDAVETMPARAFVADPNGNRTFFNMGWLEYTGLSSELASSSGWENAVHPTISSESPNDGASR